MTSLVDADRSVPTVRARNDLVTYVQSVHHEADIRRGRHCLLSSVYCELSGVRRRLSDHLNKNKVRTPALET
jgi:hypothetical protein